MTKSSRAPQSRVRGKHGFRSFIGKHRMCSKEKKQNKQVLKGGRHQGGTKIACEEEENGETENIRPVFQALHPNTAQNA